MYTTDHWQSLQISVLLLLLACSYFVFVPGLLAFREPVFKYLPGLHWNEGGVHSPISQMKQTLVVQQLYACVDKKHPPECWDFGFAPPFPV